MKLKLITYLLKLLGYEHNEVMEYDLLKSQSSRDFWYDEYSLSRDENTYLKIELDKLNESYKELDRELDRQKGIEITIRELCEELGKKNEELEVDLAECHSALSLERASHQITCKRLYSVVEYIEPRLVTEDYEEVLTVCRGIK